MIFVSVALYALAKEHGARVARQLFREQLDAPDENSLPCVRVIARLRERFDVKLFPDFGGSATAKMRSRAAAAFAESGAETWISCDDDVEAPADVLRDLLEAVAGDVPAVCLAPYWQRGGQLVMVAVEPGAVAAVRGLPSGGRAVHCLAGGFGLVAMNRACIDGAIAAHPELVYLDDDGKEKCALFSEVIARRRWWGEDLSFFRRLPEGTRVECLIAGATSHDGELLDLAHVPTLPCMTLPDWGPAPRPEVVQVHVDEPNTKAEGRATLPPADERADERASLPPPAAEGDRDPPGPASPAPPAG